MASEKGVIERVRGLGWEHMKITKAGYRGGFKKYMTASGTEVLVFFGKQDAVRLFWDDGGEFEADDYRQLIDGKLGFDVNDVVELQGTVVLASLYGNDVDDVEESSERRINFDHGAVTAFFGADDVHAEKFRDDTQAVMLQLCELFTMAPIKM